MSTPTDPAEASGGVAPAVLGLLLALLGACGPAAPVESQREADEVAARRPNIVLLISDDHDARQLGFMGARPSPTPELDALAADGLVFTEGTTAPRCRPALAGLLTGRWPHQNGVWSNASLRRLRGPNLLPKLLAEAGYACYAEGKFWEGSGRAVGFEFGPEPHANDVGLNANGFVREGQAQLFEFLEGVGERPFFVWWAPLLPHVPHNPPEALLAEVQASSIAVPDWIAAADRDAFIEAERASLAMVRWLDQGVGELRAKLRELDLERDTLFVFLIDNGWANGLISKGSPYAASVNTPIVLSWPGQVEPGRRAELVSYLDVLPTVLDYAGVALPERRAGGSLRPFAGGAEGVDDSEWRDAAFGACYAAEAAPEQRPEADLFALHVRDERWKYVRWVRAVSHSGGADRFNLQDLFVAPWSRAAGQEELFDLATDPLERADLAADPAHAERLATLRSRVDAWWTQTGGGPLPR